MCVLPKGPIVVLAAMNSEELIANVFSQLYSSDCCALSYIFLLLKRISFFPSSFRFGKRWWPLWAGGLVFCVLLGNYMREYMYERIHRIVERMSWRAFLIARKTGRNWALWEDTHYLPSTPPLGLFTLDSLLSSVFTQYYKVPGVSDQRNLR
jgi:hypothetical protein